MGWAVIPASTTGNAETTDVIVYLSGVGNQKKLRATWATLQDNRREPIKLPDGKDTHKGPIYRAARRPEGKKIYQTFFNETPLEQSGMAHMVMQHWSVLTPRAAEPFVHLTGADGRGLAASAQA